MIPLSKTISSIMKNTITIEKRDLGAPMVNREVGRIKFTISLSNTMDINKNSS